MGVGMPQTIYLDDFASQVWSAFGCPPYLVGSALKEKTGWRDVDVRLILSDDDYALQGFGDPKYPHENLKWLAMCCAFSELGKKMTGLPVDFQIQQQTLANEQFPEQPRSAIGLVVLRKACTKKHWTDVVKEAAERQDIHAGQALS